MTKTVFPSALFGICSTALLAMGLSSLRSPYSVLAEGNLPASPSWTEGAIHDRRPAEGGWVARRSPADSPSPMSFQAANDQKSGPTPGASSGGLVESLGETISSPTIGYRYYYRFVVESEEIATLGHSETWSTGAMSQSPETESLSAENAENAGRTLADDRWVSPEATDSESYCYSFVDEYSSEEAARYEMAQEHRPQDNSAPSFEVAEDGYFPWYQKYYYLMTPQVEVGRPAGRCEPPTDPSPANVSSRQSDFTQPEAGKPTGLGWTFYGGVPGPDYEADVAAAWLFAASRQMPTPTEPTADESAMSPTEAAQTPSDALPDEAYEDWEAFAITESEASEDEGLLSVTDDSAGVMEEWGEQDDLSTSAMKKGNEVYEDYERGSAWGPWYDGMELEFRDDGSPARGVSTPVGDGEASATQRGDQAGNWSILNPEPLVAHPSVPEAEESSLRLDTPLHGEPGEDFSWLEPVEQDAVQGMSDQNLSDPAETDPQPSPGTDEMPADSESAWDLEKPGYRLGLSEPSAAPQMGQPGLQDAELPSGDFPSHAPSPDPPTVDEFSEAIYEGDYAPAEYRWEMPSEASSEDATEWEVQPWVGDEAPAEESGGVSLFRLIRGLSEAAGAVLLRPWLPAADTINRWY